MNEDDRTRRYLDRMTVGGMAWVVTIAVAAGCNPTTQGGGSGGAPSSSSSSGSGAPLSSSGSGGASSSSSSSGSGMSSSSVGAGGSSSSSSSSGSGGAAGCAMGATVAWTLAFPASRLEAFAVGPAGDTVVAYGNASSTPQAILDHLDASGNNVGAADGFTDGTPGGWVGFSAAAIDPSGRVLYDLGGLSGHCPDGNCGWANIYAATGGLATVWMRGATDNYHNQPPFSAFFLGGTAAGDVFAGCDVPPVISSPPGLGVDFGGGKVTGKVLVHFDAAGTFVGQAAWPAHGVQAVGALGGLYTSYAFQGTTDAGCGAVTESVGGSTLVVKLDASGQCVWSRAYPGQVRFALGPAEELLLAAAFTGTVDFGGGPLTSAGTSDLAIAKISPSGQHLWSERFGASGASFALLAFGADVQGGPVVVVSYGGAVDFGCGAASSTPGETDTLFAGFEPSGGNRYSRVIHAQGVKRIGIDGLGGVVLLGTDATFDVGTGPLLAGPGIALARIAP